MSRGLFFMLQSVVLYTTANLLVKALAVLPTQQLVFLRSAVSLGPSRKPEPLLWRERWRAARIRLTKELIHGRMEEVRKTAIHLQV